MPDTQIELIRGDITKVEADAIVNAANTTLLGDGGVDGAIHRAAGPQLLEECRTLNGCMTGEAKITKGYNLAARYVIHTAGPVWHGGRANEEELLASCYRNSLELARKNAIRTIAFPSISTGAYRFPIEKAASIAIDTVRKFLKKNPGIFERIIFVLFSDADMEIYKKEEKVMNDHQPFSIRLRQEIEKTQERRQRYILAKLAFITGLLGIGYSANISANSMMHYLLYLIPFIAFIFDLYIIGEDLSIKRAGIFIRNSKETPAEEIDWEYGVGKSRDIFSYLATPFSTSISIILASFGLYNRRLFILWITISVILVLLLAVHRQIQNIILNKFESIIKNKK
jgi:O-acetyl-ADP-ribose deacetylase (regulator of RNase III)